jgi:hypothetical protein
MNSHTNYRLPTISRQCVCVTPFARPEIHPRFHSLSALTASATARALPERSAKCRQKF